LNLFGIVVRRVSLNFGTIDAGCKCTLFHAYIFTLPTDPQGLLFIL